ncbi:hypothetical protein J6590_060046 [Homalodisca vitripennis]|nr:hypothetical protein J6590_060046 [Homalodisca vitripennis]
MARWHGVEQCSRTYKEYWLYEKIPIRALSVLKDSESYMKAFKEHKILTVGSLYILETILYAVSCNQTRLADRHQYNTRNRHYFLLGHHHLSLYEKKPAYKGAALFNSLPTHLKRLPVNRIVTVTTNWLL